MVKISVIIPIHPNEIAHKKLISFFDDLKDDDIEILTCTGSGRANAMNSGVQDTQHDYLWFVHADTVLTKDHIVALRRSIDVHPQRIHYFNLAFSNDGLFLTKINAIGANVRSKLFGYPWGDQALAMSREVFKKLDSYDETLNYGEDHALMIKRQKHKIKLNCISVPIQTSARLYKEKGWFKLTCIRQYLWLKLTVKEFLK